MGKILYFPRPFEQGLEEADGSETLAGLDGVHIVVEDVDVDLEREGITSAVLEEIVEEMLARAGIRIFSGAELVDVPGQPLLYLQVGADRHRGGALAYIVRIELCQWVALARDSDREAMAVTWTIAGVWAADPEELVEGVLESVREGVERFVTAFLAANAKGPAN